MPALKVLLLAMALPASPCLLAQTQSDFELPGPPSNAAPAQDLWATHYFVHQAPATGEGLPFRDKAGKALSDNVRPRDWCLAAIEGTVRVPFNGVPKTLNYGGTAGSTQVDCAAVLRISPLKKPWIVSTGRSYFVAARGPFGDGVGGNRLVPYRTVAVDKNRFAFGTVIFIPAARGAVVTLPDGTSIQHDGYFYAGDTGGAIKGPHVDVFCGVTPTNCFPGFVASDAAKTFKATVVSDAQVVRALTALHR
jgi:3D (Asp-Asp-Asp) domain-containing protein